MDLDPEIAALIARQTISKAETERLNVDIEWGEVVGWDVREGVVTSVTVVLNGAPDTLVYCSSLIGSNFATGKRVAVWWTEAGGAYVIGSDEAASDTADLMQHPYLVADGEGSVSSGVSQQVVFDSTVDSWPGGETVRPWREPDDGTNPIDFADNNLDSVTINEDGLYLIEADVQWTIEGGGV